MGVVGEALKWVRRAGGQTGSEWHWVPIVVWRKPGSPSEPLLGQPRAAEGRGWSLRPSLSWNRSCLCAPCLLCGRADKGRKRRGLARYRIVGMGSRYVGRSSPEAQHDPGLDVSRRNVQSVRSGGGGGRKAATDGQEED